MNSTHLNSISKLVGAQVNRIREMQQLSLDELCKRSGLPIHIIESIENGSCDPTLDCIVALAESMGVRPQDFLDLDF